MDKLTIDEVIEHCEKTVKLENNLILKGRRCGGKVQYTKRYLEHLQVGEWLKELNQYKDLEEQGKLILFPEYAYFIKDNKIHKGWVQEVVHSLCRKPLYDIRYDDNSIASYREYLGNKVFLTKEDAEKAIERLEKDNE